ncbi:hypothetical protein AB0O28_18275 [Microbispora sp. NPDC088329]|uniref:hypothetical protein n=1 Tax=Microbispora sp. NPDC088329 TaxID=3154869 RepID=UPI0034419A07
MGDAKTVSNTVRVLRGVGETLGEALGLALGLALGDADGDAEGLATGIVATAGAVLAPVVAIAQVYSVVGVVVVFVPVPAGAIILMVKSFAVSATEVAPADGVTVSVAVGSGGIVPWAATAEVNAAPVGEGVETPAVAVAGSTVAATLGCNSIDAPFAIATGAGNADVVTGVKLKVAVYTVPVPVEVSDTVKS